MCQKHVARIVYFVSICIVISSVIALALSVVYLYLPGVANYHKDTCTVNRCNGFGMYNCCYGEGASRSCRWGFFNQITFTLNLNKENYTQTSQWDCDAGNTADTYSYKNMCMDPELKTIACYYDDRDIFNTLYLTSYYQKLPPAGLACVIIFTLLAFGCIIYLIVYWSCYRQLY